MTSSQMGIDFSFDNRVAGQYNAQRAYPPGVADEIGAAIAAQAGAGARILEVGVGTGRIAHPVIAAGCRVTGIDISPDMLGEVFTAVSTTPALSLAQADMHRLPFRARSFDAVLTVHVLHLATDWQQVITEIARMLRPGGAFIQGDDWMDPASVVGQLRDELRRAAVAYSPQLRPPAAGNSREQALAAVGGTAVHTAVAAEWTTWISPNERLAAIENRMDAESWFLPDALFTRLLAHLRAFAAQTWPDLDEKQPVTRRFVMKVIRGAW